MLPYFVWNSCLFSKTVGNSSLFCLNKRICEKSESNIKQLINNPLLQSEAVNSGLPVLWEFFQRNCSNNADYPIKGIFRISGNVLKKTQSQNSASIYPERQLMWKENPSVIGFIQYPMNPKRYLTNQHIKQEDGHENIYGS